MTKIVRNATTTASVALLVASCIAFSTSATAGLVPNHLIDPTEAVSASNELRLKPAYDALRNGKADEAAAAFAERLRLVPNDPDAMLGMAAVEQSRGNGEAALGWMRRALMVSPDDPALLHANARLLLEQNQPGDAARSLEQAVKADPHAEALRRELAALLMQLGRAPDAVVHYRKLYETKPDDAKSAAELGVALVAAGKFAEGASLLEQVLPSVPGDLTALNALGHARLRMGRNAEALAAFDRLIAANKAYPPAWLARGDALMGLDRFGDAVEAYQQAERLSKVPLAALKRGVALEKLGRRGDAEAAYKAALKLDPDYGPAYNNLAFMFAGQAARRDDALGWAKKAVESNQRLAAYHDTLGWVRQQRGELDLARAAYGQALMIDANHEAARRHLRALDSVALASAEPVAVRPTPPTSPERGDFSKEVPQPPQIPAAVPEPVQTAAPASPAGAMPAAAAAVARAEPASKSAPDFTAQLRQRLEAWRTAWQGKRVDDYLAMYGAGFAPPSGMDRAAWEADRHRKLGKNGEIRVEISDLEVSVQGAKASTRFRQRYSSSNYADETQKTLDWALVGGIWKIAGEEATPVK